MTQGFIPSPRARTAVIFSALTLLLVGCAQVRQLTYPPDFKWIDDSDIQTTMQSMASRLYRLDELVNDTSERRLDGSSNGHSAAAETIRGDTRQQVLTELEGIEALASTLLATGSNTIAGEEARLKTNHLLLDEHLDDFIAQLSRARWQVEAEPPSYYGVGHLTGNCNACHRIRD